MNVGKDIILVTGATGQQGGAVARKLLSRNHKVRAMTRKPTSEFAKALANLGAEIIQGDLDDDASLERAVQGVWGVFAVQNTWEAGVEKEEIQGKRIAEISKKTGVYHYVYSSVGSADRKTGIPHFDNKWRVEGLYVDLAFHPLRFCGRFSLWRTFSHRGSSRESTRESLWSGLNRPRCCR
jgi:uncharacterized protein YbjT (DUF2867 family)